MAKFLIRRFAALIALLIATSFVTFTLFHYGPSDPAADSCGKNCTPAQIQDARVALGLNKSFGTQYLDYMEGLVHSRTVGPPNAPIHCGWPCFGLSYQGGTQLVWNQLKQALPYTICIAIGAAIIWLLFGVALGVIAALRKGKLEDRLAVGLSAFGVSAPVPLIGLVALWLVPGKLGILPYPSSTIEWPWDHGIWPFIKNYIMPWLTLALLYGASYVRLTRASMIETMGEDYIRTARAKGLPRRTVVMKHGLRAGITPIVTIFGLDLGALLGGAALTESIYSLPGIGKLAVDAAIAGNLPVTLAVVLFAAFFVIFANIIVDMLYAVIDPRVRLS